MDSQNDAPLELEPIAAYRDRLQDGAQGAEEAEGEGKPKAPLKLRLLLLAILALVGWETGATVVQRASAPHEDDWKAAAQKASEKREAAEPLLFAPLWVEPLGRHHFGEQLNLEQLTMSDVDRFERVWQVSVRGRLHPWLRGLNAAESWTFGGVTLGLFIKKPEKVLFDFTREIRSAKVSRMKDRPQRCAWRRDRFLCDPKQKWNWVGPQLAEVGHRPYRCIFAHPVEGHVMRIDFPAAALGRSLVGYTGIDDFENRKRAGGPVLLKVYVGPKLLGSVLHRNRWPWKRFQFNTSEYGEQTHPVRFEITADRAYARTFCFAAETRE